MNVKSRNVVLLIIFLWLHSAAHAGYTIIVNPSTRVSTVVDGSSPKIVTGANSAQTNSMGTDLSQCEPYGRLAAVSADASVSPKKAGKNSVSLNLAATVISSGGHFRTCAACGLNQCIGVKGHDTKSAGDATSSATIIVKFDDITLPGRYSFIVLQELSGESTSSSVQVASSRGNNVTSDSLGRYLADVQPNDIYTISAKISVAAANTGECCTDSRQSTLGLNVVVERMPENIPGQTPFILNGTFTSEFPQVGVITIKSGNGIVSPHCTATLIGRKTILTAAHCVADDFEPAWKEGRMRFILGTSIDDPKGDSFKILSALFPRTKDYHYQVVKGKGGSISTIDDVAVAYLESRSDKVPLALYNGTMPTVQDLIDHSEPLAFIGFGLYSIESDGTGGSGSGKKRQALVPIASQDKRTIYYKTNSNGQGTCRGDSGGPTLLESPQKPWRVVAVTAYGATDCSDGRSMKVDAFSTWIVPLIQN